MPVEDDDTTVSQPEIARARRLDDTVTDHASSEKMQSAQPTVVSAEPDSALVANEDTKAGSNEALPISPAAQWCVTFFTLIGVYEILMTCYYKKVLGEELPKWTQVLFPAMLLVHLVLRLRISSQSTVWWPLAPTVLACLFADKFQIVVNDPPPYLLVGKISLRIINKLLRNPVQAYRMFRSLMRLLRWVRWGIPIWQRMLKTKDAVSRLRLTRRERLHHERALRAAHALRAQADLPSRITEATIQIQSAYRARHARKQTAKELCRRKTVRVQRELWAARRLVRAVDRSKLSAKADEKPLLFSPDALFISLWKALVLFTVLLDVQRTFLSDKGETITQSEIFALVADPACAAAPGKRRLALGPRKLPQLPAHCSRYTFASTMIGGVAEVLSFVVGCIASIDIFVEFKIGVGGPHVN